MTDPTADPNADPSAPPPTVYDRLRGAGIVRTSSGKWVAGVASGIGRRFGIDPALVRVAFILLSVIFGIGITVYLIAWLLLPAEDGSLMVERAVRDGEAGPIVLIVVAGLSLLADFSPNIGGDRGNVVGLAALAVAAWWFLTRTDQGREFRAQRGGRPTRTAAPSPAASAGTFVGTYPLSPGNAAAAAGARVNQPMPPTSVPAPRRVTRGVGFFASLLIGGMALTIGGVVTLVTASGVVGLSVALGLVGLAIIAAGLRGRRGGWLTWGAIAGLVALSLSVAPTSFVSQYGTQAGDRSVTVTRAVNGQVDRLAAGSLVVDYTNADTRGAGVEYMTASVGVGELTVIVPADQDVQVNSHVRLGELTSDGANQSGPDLTSQSAVSRSPQLVIDAQVGLGQLTVISR